MSLTRAFRTAQRANPLWGYRQLADFLHCDIQLLRGLNSRLKLPIPVRPKAPKGQAKRRFDNNPKSYGYLKFGRERISLEPEPAPKAKATSKAKFVPQASGRKQYGSYLKLL